MDRNTVIGLVLIGLVLTTFAIFNQPSPEEIAAAKARAKQVQLREKKKADAQKNANAKKSADSDTLQMSTNWTPKLDEKKEIVKDSSGSFVYVDSLGNDTLIAATSAMLPDSLREKKSKIVGELITITTDKLIIDFDTKGAQIASVKLKEFESFNDFYKNGKKDPEIQPLVLFDRGDASQGLTFPMGTKIVNTADELFVVTKQTANKIVFELKTGEGSIEFVYQLKKDAYDLDFDINIKGLGGQVTPKNVMYNWDVAYKLTERLMSEQRRVSTVCYNYEEEGFSYLSEMSNDDIVAEDDIDWVCYKQSYFSSFLRPENSFGKSGSTFKVTNYNEGSARNETHVKSYRSELNLNLKNVDNANVSMNWFFGPNDYSVLTSYDGGYDQVLNYGWGIFRWINIYAVQPIFDLLNGTGMAIGIAILLLTLLLKLVLMPIQWKMYTSSAKMRILKPEIDEINAKYPNKDDAMKKQMEVMGLYRESGASPLAGCVPMLIQMPILLAVFRFFPSAFDLRQKGFLWAEDLSSYDSIATLPWNIPIYGDHVSLFTLLMAVTTLIYTHINSSNMSAQQQPGMPNMKIIMYFFPIMMIFFFNNYSSGLSYYYFISTLISILMMIMIKKFFVDEDKIKLKMAERKANAGEGGTKKSGKSKFQERLEKMQKAQQEQLAKRKK